MHQACHISLGDRYSAHTPSLKVCAHDCPLRFVATIRLHDNTKWCWDWNLGNRDEGDRTNNPFFPSQKKPATSITFLIIFTKGFFIPSPLNFIPHVFWPVCRWNQEICFKITRYFNTYTSDVKHAANHPLLTGYSSDMANRDTYTWEVDLYRLFWR